MPKHLPQRRAKVGKKERQRRAAQNLAKGMPQEQALIEAGYSPNYAASKAYKVVKKPYIRSLPRRWNE
jgi:phage terminase small subunit